MKDKYKAIGEQAPHGDMLKAILDIFKEFDMGVGVYKASPNLSSWFELVHDLNPVSPTFGYAIEKPCN